jgi:hypothetical protein
LCERGLVGKRFQWRGLPEEEEVTWLQDKGKRRKFPKNGCIRRCGM